MKRAVLCILLVLNPVAGLVLVPLLRVDNGSVEGLIMSHFCGLRHEGIIDDGVLAIILDGHPAAGRQESFAGIHKLVNKGHAATIGRWVSFLLAVNALALASCLRWRERAVSAPRRGE